MGRGQAAGATILVDGSAQKDCSDTRLSRDQARILIAAQPVPQNGECQVLMPARHRKQQVQHEVPKLLHLNRMATHASDRT